MERLVTALGLLLNARERLAVPGAWLHRCAYAAAVTAEGEACSPDDPRAVCWDLYGALRAAGARPGDNASDEAWSLVTGAAGVSASSHFGAQCAMANWHEAPERTREDVLAVLNSAVQRARGRAA